MNKKFIMIFIGTIAVVAAVFLIVISNQPSIGIIGGADGPTSIFLESNFIDYLIPIIAVIVLLILKIVLSIKKPKK